MKPLITCLLASVLTFGGLASAESRTWTAAQGGATFEGELREVKGDKVSILRKDGKLFEVPIARLSDADKKFITDSQAKPGDDPAAATPSAADMKIPEGETELILTEAHACCRGCYDAIEGSLGTLTGVEVSAKKGQITIKGESGGLVKAALGYIMEKGFYGKPSIPAFADTKKYKTDMVKEMYLSRFHLCCGACEDELEEALETVEGIKEFSEIKKGVSEIHIEGEFTQAQVMAALHDKGFHASLSATSRN